MLCKVNVYGIHDFKDTFDRNFLKKFLYAY